jgi:hypothetical protein
MIHDEQKHIDQPTSHTVFSNWDAPWENPPWMDWNTRVLEWYNCIMLLAGQATLRACLYEFRYS